MVLVLVVRSEDTVYVFLPFSQPPFKIRMAEIPGKQALGLWNDRDTRSSIIELLLLYISGMLRGPREWNWCGGVFSTSILAAALFEILGWA